MFPFKYDALRYVSADGKASTFTFQGRSELHQIAENILRLMVADHRIAKVDVLPEDKAAYGGLKYYEIAKLSSSIGRAIAVDVHRDAAVDALIHFLDGGTSLQVLHKKAEFSESKWVEVMEDNAERWEHYVTPNTTFIKANAMDFLIMFNEGVFEVGLENGEDKWFTSIPVPTNGLFPTLVKMDFVEENEEQL